MLLAKRQNAEFAELVEKNMAFKHIEERKRKKSGETPLVAAAMHVDDELSKTKKRKFHQVKSMGENHSGMDGVVDRSLLKRIVNNGRKLLE